MSVNEVKSAKRVLEIVQFFAEERSPATLSQLAAALGFPKSSCLALLETLEADGWAYQIGGRYYLTRRWLNESRVIAEHDPFTATIRPVLEELQAELGETLILAHRLGDRVVYLEVSEPARVVRFSARVGETKPLHAAASGRALLGAMDVEARREIASRLTFKRYTEATLANATALLDKVEQEAARGWHVNFGEHQADTLSVAAPLVMYGEPFALVVGAPMFRAGAAADRIGQTLAATCRTVVRGIASPRSDSFKE